MRWSYVDPTTDFLPFTAGNRAGNKRDMPTLRLLAQASDSSVFPADYQVAFAHPHRKPGQSAATHSLHYLLAQASYGTVGGLHAHGGEKDMDMWINCMWVLVPISWLMIAAIDVNHD